MKKLLIIIVLFLGFDSQAQKELSQKELVQKIFASKKGIKKEVGYKNKQIVFSSGKWKYTIWTSKESISFWRRPIGTNSKDLIETWTLDRNDKITSFSNKEEAYLYGDCYEKNSRKPVEKKRKEQLIEYFEGLNRQAIIGLTKRL